MYTIKVATLSLSLIFSPRKERRGGIFVCDKRKKVGNLVEKKTRRTLVRPNLDEASHQSII